ncbi:hypothetical protein ACS126_03575 [Sphingobacterium lactis]|uniref:hypothetical protein n=1 Tax=Sphingobacterium TaxID=28453 RepID=UPI0021A960F1|nr:hypothetical protein [Sphingobacterium hotanense]MCT1526073.1 hypothetical protein [Sphingobacterium hotanense]
MEKVTKNIHRGRVLHEAARHHPKKIKDIVIAAGYKYGTFYKHKNDPKLSFEIIAKYGKVMDKDFSVEFPEMANLPSLLISESNTESKSNDQLQIEINDLREKYSALLVKHNSLLEANIVLREENIQLKEEIASLKLK